MLTSAPVLAVLVEVIFEGDTLVFRDYPFAPASVRHQPRVAARRIWAYNPNGCPPVLYLEASECLFVSATCKEKLDSWCARHQIPVREPVDVWALLLEPYLDTEHSPKYQAGVEERLAACGFTVSEVEAIRGRVASRVLAYNAVLWEWVHLGHYDVLEAMKWSFPWTYARFYQDSMAIALRGFNG